jgi:hypothetical protein
VIDGRNDFLGDFRQGIGMPDMSNGSDLPPEKSLNLM